MHPDLNVITVYNVTRNYIHLVLKVSKRIILTRHEGTGSQSSHFLITFHWAMPPKTKSDKPDCIVAEINFKRLAEDSLFCVVLELGNYTILGEHQRIWYYKIGMSANCVYKLDGITNQSFFGVNSFAVGSFCRSKKMEIDFWL